MLALYDQIFGPTASLNVLLILIEIGNQRRPRNPAPAKQPIIGLVSFGRGLQYVKATLNLQRLKLMTCRQKVSLKVH